MTGDGLGTSGRERLKPRIDGTAFGSITVEGTVFEHDVIIRPDGGVKKRKKKLSKAVYGTSHKLSLQEAKQVCGQGAGADRLIVGSGQYGNVELSPEAVAYMQRRKCRVVLLPTPEAIDAWNETEGGAIGLFHVTC
jgi:hypothetical protein